MTAQPSAATVARPDRPDRSMAVKNLIRFLETGSAPEGLFAPDVFFDLSLPHWRVQGRSLAGRLDDVAAHVLDPDARL